MHSLDEEKKIIEQLEKMKEQKKREADKLALEKEMIMRKCKNISRNKDLNCSNIDAKKNMNSVIGNISQKIQDKLTLKEQLNRCSKSETRKFVNEDNNSLNM